MCNDICVLYLSISFLVIILIYMNHFQVLLLDLVDWYQCSNTLLTEVLPSAGFICFCIYIHFFQQWYLVLRFSILKCMYMNSGSHTMKATLALGTWSEFLNLQITVVMNLFVIVLYICYFLRNSSTAYVIYLVMNIAVINIYIYIYICIKQGTVSDVL
jgi:hypothetical protein